MPDNTQRFTGRVQDYDRYRQRYPAQEILARLQSWCGLSSQWLVADVGAGTGMVADIFLANGNRVIAVEPNVEMLDHMRSSYAPPHVHATHMQIVEATAEETTLSSDAVDLVAVGRAFHWFDKERAIAEFRRILKPGGWMTLVAADRDRDTVEPAFRAQTDAFEHLLSDYGTDYTRVRSGYRTYEKMDTFLDGEVHQEQLHGTRQLDWTAFHGHVMSLSVSPQPGHPNAETFARELHRHFDTFASDGVLTIPTICWITAGRFAWHP